MSDRHRTETRTDRKSNFHPLEAFCHDCDWTTEGPSGRVYNEMDAHERTPLTTSGNAATSTDGAS